MASMRTSASLISRAAFVSGKEALSPNFSHNDWFFCASLFLACPASTTLTSYPLFANRRAIANPSPPLLPFPQQTTTPASGSFFNLFSSTQSATLRAAFSIKTEPEIPKSSIACRSISRMESVSASRIKLLVFWSICCQRSDWRINCLTKVFDSCLLLFL